MTREEKLEKLKGYQFDKSDWVIIPKNATFTDIVKALKSKTAPKGGSLIWP